jgi:hypothetical protein
MACGMVNDGRVDIEEEMMSLHRAFLIEGELSVQEHEVHERAN